MVAGGSAAGDGAGDSERADNGEGTVAVGRAIGRTTWVGRAGAARWGAGRAAAGGTAAAGCAGGGGVISTRRASSVNGRTGSGLSDSPSTKQSMKTDHSATARTNPVIARVPCASNSLARRKLMARTMLWIVTLDRNEEMARSAPAGLQHGLDDQPVRRAGVCRDHHVAIGGQ